MNPAERCEAQFDDGLQSRAKRLGGCFGFSRLKAWEIVHDNEMEDEDVTAWIAAYHVATRDERITMTGQVQNLKNPSERPPPPPVADARDRPVYVDEREPDADREPPASPQEAARYRRELLQRLRGIGGAS